MIGLASSLLVTEVIRDGDIDAGGEVGGGDMSFLCRRVEARRERRLLESDKLE